MAVISFLVLSKPAHIILMPMQSCMQKHTKAIQGLHVLWVIQITTNTHTHTTQETKLKKPTLGGTSQCFDLLYFAVRPKSRGRGVDRIPRRRTHGSMEAWGRAAESLDDYVCSCVGPPARFARGRKRKYSRRKRRNLWDVFLSSGIFFSPAI